MCGSGSATQASRQAPRAASTPRSKPPWPVHNDPMTGPDPVAAGTAPAAVLVTGEGA
ncbi:hypothetical protein EDD40_2646 [Saccharothrix texasensis]|uniref:Uncharacterized protein n=1 Tax=Saccharothrix texasensis TaxID=103734 RepID=A0A3N1H4C1_9PSEU|nr:hypothetical protein EDD40_2646 [Saccharothrix texasensis]